MTYTTRTGLTAERITRRITRRDGYSYLRFGWMVIEAGARRTATAAESRDLNARYGYSAASGHSYGHPSIGL